MICAPSDSSTSCGTAFTVPAVPTGMKTGVSTTWWGSASCARRPPAAVVLLMLNWSPTDSFYRAAPCDLFPDFPEPHIDSNARCPWHAQRCGRCFGNLDLPVEEVFGGREHFEVIAERVRPVGIQTEIAVQQGSVCVVIKLP